MKARSSQQYARAFLSPTIIILLLFSIFPFVFSLALSFGKVSLTGGLHVALIGGRNWARLLHDARFWNAVNVTVRIVAISVPVEYLLGLGLALLLNQKVRGQNFFRIVFMTPMMLAPIAVGYVGRMMFNDTHGPINDLIRHLGFHTVGWLSDPHVAVYSIILTDIWQWTPLMFLILLAGLQAVPNDYLDAAKVDGASAWQRFYYVLFPLLAPISFAALVLRTIEGFKIIDTIYIMTGGGPGLSTESLTMYGYSAGLETFELAHAATIALALFLLVLLLIMLLVPVMRYVHTITLE